MSDEVRLDETQEEPELGLPEPEPGVPDADSDIEAQTVTIDDGVVETADEPEVVEVSAEADEPETADAAEQTAGSGVDEDTVAEPVPVIAETPSDAQTVADEGDTSVPGDMLPEPSDPPEPEEAGEPRTDETETEGPGDSIDDDISTELLDAPESFEEMLEKSIKTLHTGEKVSGIVTSITATEVSVDLGTKQSGYIPIGEFLDETNTNIDDVVKIGDTIESFVMRVNDVEGMVMLSKRRLDAIKNWDIIEAAKDSRAIVEGIVTEENKGGVVVNVKGVRVFVPASQTGLPKSSPMADLVKKTIKLRITEVNASRRRVVGSIRAVAADERREKSDRLWSEIETGKQYSGVVKSMTSYGVFVDIGGVDGMIHISELSWTRIKQPSEVMSVGDEVSVYVLSFDKENRKISLGYKRNEDNPWTRFTTGNAIGDVVKVKIVKMMPFGAFAEIIPGVDGLIHISQITDHRIGLPSEILSNGQVVDVKITEIDNDRKKVSLSIKALIDPSSLPVTDAEAEDAASSDKSPVVVYDTDAPPADFQEPAGEPEDGAEVD